MTVEERARLAEDDRFLRCGCVTARARRGLDGVVAADGEQAPRGEWIIVCMGGQP